MDLIWEVAKNRMRYARGAGWAGMLLAFVSTLTFAKVWEPTFVYFGIPTKLIYFGLPTAYLFTCWVIGYIDEKKKLWEAEVKYSNNVLNKEWLDLVEQVQQIKKSTDNIQSKINGMCQNNDK
jgi:hypothetical protein